MAFAARRLGGLARRGHQGVVVVERNDVENQAFDGWREGSGQGFKAAGAFLK
jgi:hypothetical protein